MKKAIIALLVVVMAFLSFQKYQEHTEIELLTRAISDTTARASTTLDILRGGHRVPIADFIKQTEAHNQALSNHIISIKSNIGSKRHVETAFAISYIEQTAIVFRSATKLSRTIIEARLAKDKLNKTIATLQNFVNNPGNDRARYAANMEDSDAVSQRVDIAKADFDVAILQFQLDLTDLSSIKPPNKSKIPATAILSANDFKDIEITLFK